jgi:hypothetical protein
MSAQHRPYNISMNSQEVHIGTIPLQNLRDIHKKKEEHELCPEAAFMNNDKNQVYQVITGTVGDIVKSKTKKR